MGSAWQLTDPPEHVHRPWHGVSRPPLHVMRLVAGGNGVGVGPAPHEDVVKLMLRSGKKPGAMTDAEVLVAARRTRGRVHCVVLVLCWGVRKGG